MLWRSEPPRPVQGVLSKRMGPLETPLARRIALCKSRSLSWRRRVVRGKTFAYQRCTNRWAGLLGAAIICLSALLAFVSGRCPSTLPAVALALPAELVLLLAVILWCRIAVMSSAVQFIQRTKTTGRGPPITLTVRGPFRRAATLTIPADGTTADILQDLRRRRLVGNLASIAYTFTCERKSIQDNEKLCNAGVGDLSTLDLRLLRRGGASPSNPPPQPPEWDPSSTEFSSRRGVFQSANPEFWRPAGNKRFLCTICDGSTPTESHNIPGHEKTRKHKSNVALRTAAQPRMANNDEPGPSAPQRQAAPAESRGEVRGILSGILRDMTAPRQEDAWVDLETGTANFSDAFVSMDGQMHDPDAQMDRVFAAQLEEYLNAPPSDIDSDEQGDERSNPDSEREEPAPKPFVFGRGRRTIDLSDTTNDWFPWPDRETFVLDILRHVPRCAFSRTQNTAIHWAMQALGLENLPSDRVMDDIDKALQPLCGVQSIRYDGKLGNVYYANDLAAIIAQEMANPLVRDKLHFLPEDSGKKVSQTWQARRWRHELDADLTTPMIRLGKQDFYLHEPCLLKDGTACMPTRWFTRGNEMFAETWKLIPANIDGRTGWIVDATERDEETRSREAVNSSEFLIAFPTFKASYFSHQIPDPSMILGMFPMLSSWSFAHVLSGMKTSLPDLQPWNKTDPAIGNPWRLKASNHRVVAFPLWLYCDDTSGNTSKKWNKHNSFLVTAAGLPRKYVHREFNIHFLATSNIAPTLEMLDGLVDQLEKGQTDGIWAWDVVLQELVLVIPSVLALLGDNPMQSEFACHIGFVGKYFCREIGKLLPHPLPLVTAVLSLRVRRRRRKKQQTVSEMISRISNFMMVGRLRNRTETCEKLRSQFTTASIIGNQTAYRDMKTTSGLKDTYQEAFIERLFAVASKKGRTKPQKQAEMNRLKATFPTNTLSPVWRIKDLDPHRDTPVEILHVVLLGFVKYFWRDAVARLKDSEKKILETRLSSFDVSGLGISPLPGHTLVRYAGSLVGRDFRAIVQVAPFVLQGLLSEERIAAWVALSRVVALVWQPAIEDIDSYCAELEQCISHFLNCACRLSINWFNKSKFHVILHLPDHIRRFGPAMLFATEGFESFNAIIRSCSIHSNRHAPSRDIATRMARGNRLRHLLSGGLFRAHTAVPSTTRAAPPSSSPWMQHTLADLSASRWVSIHDKPKALLKQDAFGSRLLGFMESEEATIVGLCDKIGPLVRWHLTKSSRSPGARLLPQLSGRPLDTLTVHNPAAVYVSNGDKALVASSVVYRRQLDGKVENRVGQIAEIVQIPGSAAHAAGCADFILITECIVGEEHTRYSMRQVQPTHEFTFTAAEDILCTVNVQHNCVDNGCKPARTKRKFQEREEISEKGDEIRHIDGSSAVNWIMNTAQMRDASTLSSFRPALSPLPRDTVIKAAAEFEFKSRPSRKADDFLAPDPPQQSRPSTPVASFSSPKVPPQPNPTHSRPDIWHSGTQFQPGVYGFTFSDLEEPHQYASGSSSSSGALFGAQFPGGSSMAPDGHHEWEYGWDSQYGP
ncbi:hypothetical protein MKEN_00216800 [Mycena kentingensis (nom. inval.)]|nr:hypothetical protein MKEN_00216800 [Mycena kentingensis (nom. inval.)]